MKTETLCSCTNGNLSAKNMKRMVDEVSNLKSELAKAHNLIRIQRTRYQHLVSLYQTRLQEKQEETCADLRTKHIHLTRILRSLYILEAKLRKEQQVLKSTLHEKDALVSKQELEIHKLKTELQKLACNSKYTCGAPLSPTKLGETRYCEPNNKPDLISSIGIEALNEEQSSPPASHSSIAEDNAFVIASLDDYDASWSTLHVRSDSRPEQCTPKSLPSKFKPNEEICLPGHPSPLMILKEVTENPSQKLNDPVLNCVKQILSQDRVGRVRASAQSRPDKPPKPMVPSTHNSRFETNVSKVFLRDKTNLSVKPLLPKPNAVLAEATVVRPLKATHLVNGESHKGEKSNSSNESKIVQIVSSLLSDSAESDDEQRDEKSPPTVSQMVKKFEGMTGEKKENATKSENGGPVAAPRANSIMLQTNFEEFHLVDKEIDSTCEDIVKDHMIRLEAEGEETATVSSIIDDTTKSAPSLTLDSKENAKFETFLEVTGLSQKSILTPSRTLSNHRNMIKPKDVKYRSKVKAAAGINEKCMMNGACNTGPAMKYWTEPYL